MPPAESAAAPSAVDRRALADWFQCTRARSRQIFDFVSPDAFLSRPIPLRHPIVFYEGHLPVFSFNTIVRRALGQPGINAEFEQLFARGIDPADEAAAVKRGIATWPARQAIADYAAAADRAVSHAIATADIELDGHPLLNRAQAVYAAIEHEAMHQETLLYILHRLPFEQKRHVAARLGFIQGARADAVSAAPRPGTVSIPAGRATLGAERDEVAFGWDNEFDSFQAHVPAFDIDVYDVTNGEYHAFIDAGGYDTPEWWTPEGWQWRVEHEVRHPLFWERHDGRWFWRGLFDLVPLPSSWPVYVSHVEASAYARWKGKRLPTEAEFHRAAFGTPSGEERPFPWGAEPPDAAVHGNFDFANWDPVPVGSYPQGASAWGVHDLVGNGWEWTSSVFGPFPGFAPLPSYPEYSADFFDNQHYVMKGASPGTARELVRRSFRNWFRAQYPYVYATFRLVGA
jgi:gamma-glutamyl hercynylcysteine S-oxide synthase